MAPPSKWGNDDGDLFLQCEEYFGEGAKRDRVRGRVTASNLALKQHCCKEGWMRVK